jgi:hypothetical protein
LLTEAEARVLLRDCGGFGGLEAWIAGRRWKAAPGGWTVTGELQGWSFQLEPIAGGVDRDRYGKGHLTGKCQRAVSPSA